MRPAEALALAALAALALVPDLGRRLLAADPIRPAATEAPAGTYTLDRQHASLIFRAITWVFPTIPRASRVLRPR